MPVDATDRSCWPPRRPIEHVMIETETPARVATYDRVEPAVAVEARGVTKRFGDNEALSSLDLALPKGQISVLLGPNGAGKTTTARMITGALEPNDGEIVVFGEQPGESARSLRARCGVVSAKPALYDRLSGYDNLMFAAELYGVNDGADGKIRAEAARFEIEHALDDKVGGYSTGMKTRLALARSVLHRPDLLLLDEPTSGLDPESAATVLSLIREMTSEGTTVVMCTHHLVEAEGLADHVVMMELGTSVLAGAPRDLTDSYWPDALVQIEAEDPSMLEFLSHEPGVIRVERGLPLRVYLDDYRRVSELVTSCVTHGVSLTRVDPWRPSLQDLYFRVRQENGVRRGEDTLQSNNTRQGEDTEALVK
jgi:ABC-2 type transport system ATP-binding protein